MDKNQDPVGYGLVTPEKAREWEKREIQRAKQEAREWQEKCKGLESEVHALRLQVEHFKERASENWTQVETLKWVIKNLPR